MENPVFHCQRNSFDIPPNVKVALDPVAFLVNGGCNPRLFGNCLLMWTTVNNCAFGFSQVDSHPSAVWDFDRRLDLFPRGQQFTSRIIFIPHADRYASRLGQTLVIPPGQRQQCSECRLFIGPPLTARLWERLVCVWETSNTHIPPMAWLGFLTPLWRFGGSDDCVTTT